MNTKFKVYAQTRATRQLAGDVANSIKVDYSDRSAEGIKAREEKAAWQTIEDLLNAIERKLEKLDLN